MIDADIALRISVFLGERSNLYEASSEFRCHGHFRQYYLDMRVSFLCDDCSKEVAFRVKQHSHLEDSWICFRSCDSLYMWHSTGSDVLCEDCGSFADERNAHLRHNYDIADYVRY